MLKKRIIVCLDVKENRVVKGIRFRQLADLGDPAEMAKSYAEQGADELVFLDISASLEERNTRFQWVKNVARMINIPFTVGGGISSLEDAKMLLQNGADKVSINTSALSRPGLISELVSHLGSQSVVVAVDTQPDNKGEYEVFSHGGTKLTLRKLDEWLIEAERLGAGEFLITGIHSDGTRQGFDIMLYQKCVQICRIPVIASGGAGQTEHFIDVFKKTKVSGALAAGIFHRKEILISDLKKSLYNQNIPIRL